MIAGAPVRFSTAKEFDLDGNALEVSDVDHVTVTVYPDRSTTPVLATTAMAYDGATGHWAYTWDTSAVDPGIFESKIEITTVDGFTTPRCERFALESC